MKVSKKLSFMVALTMVAGSVLIGCGKENNVAEAEQTANMTEEMKETSPADLPKEKEDEKTEEVLKSISETAEVKVEEDITEPMEPEMPDAISEVNEDGSITTYSNADGEVSALTPSYLLENAEDNSNADLVEVNIDYAYGAYQKTVDGKTVEFRIDYYTDDYGGPIRIVIGGKEYSSEWLPSEKDNEANINGEGIDGTAAFYEGAMVLHLTGAPFDNINIVNGTYSLTESLLDVH